MVLFVQKSRLLLGAESSIKTTEPQILQYYQKISITASEKRYLFEEKKLPKVD